VECAACLASDQEQAEARRALVGAGVDKLLVEAVPLAAGIRNLAAKMPPPREVDEEAISAKVHQQWMDTKRWSGIASRKSEDGEELMVPYEQLSEKAKDLDRGSVRAVLAAMAAMGAAPTPPQAREVVAVDDAMVERACKASYRDIDWNYGAIEDALQMCRPYVVRGWMRAALLAALSKP
jgi:hypothetical protein